MRVSFVVASSLISTALLLSQSEAQSPAAIVVPAANAVPATAQIGPGTSASTVPGPATIRMLQEMKATNGETLRKQEATLVLLDELQKAAEQIRILSKRG